jgi:hypothetical protein
MSVRDQESEMGHILLLIHPVAEGNLRPVLVIPAKAGIQFNISGSRVQAAG